jgi:predicted transport protein
VLPRAPPSTFVCAIRKAMTKAWACPRCERRFSRKNQRHACGTGDRNQVLRNRPAALVALYAELEAFLNTLGQIEVVARDRYVLFRSTRIFADLSVMTDSLRLVIHLARPAQHALFEKVVSDRRHVSHVVKLHDAQELGEMKPFLREAYRTSLSA